MVLQVSLTRDEYIELIKSSALSMGKKMAINFIVSKIPFFSLPIINPLLSIVVGYVLEIAIRHTELGVFFLYIDLRTTQQGRDFESAALKNFHAQKYGTDEEKKYAEADLINKFRDFYKLTH